jgi:hypothetical protein
VLGRLLFLIADDTVAFLCVYGGDRGGGKYSNRSHKAETLSADKTYYLVFKPLNIRLLDISSLFYGTSQKKKGERCQIPWIIYGWTTEVQAPH